MQDDKIKVKLKIFGEYCPYVHSRRNSSPAINTATKDC